jgi:D-xylose reductase
MEIPAVGLGTWKIPKEEAAAVVYEAIKEAGIRHIDCACDYGNEVEVGQGIRRAIEEGVVMREDLWVTSKLWNTYHKAEHVEKACRKSLADLSLDYLDLYLVHFPIALKYVPIEERYPPEWIHDPSAEKPTIVEETNAPMHLTWRAMEELVLDKLCKRIGVCNFNVQLLSDLLSYAAIPPYLNQVELHPYLVQQTLLDWCASRNVRCTAFSPLGSPSYVSLGADKGLGEGVLQDSAVLEIAETHGRTAAQVVLRWNLQRGVSIVPKSSRLERTKENAAAQDFTLTKEEVSKPLAPTVRVACIVCCAVSEQLLHVHTVCTSK